MRKDSLGLLLLLSVLMNCGGSTSKKLRLELPAYSSLNLKEFQELVMIEFLIVSSPEGFDLSQELSAFFVPEFERKLSLPATVQSVQWESEEPFRRPDFWLALTPMSARRLYITGKAELTRDVRKFILGEVPGEDPFSPRREVAERTFFSLSLRILLIRGKDGEALLDRNFKETKTYNRTDPRTDFAFYDLALRIKDKLFRQILSEERIQQRYLLMK